MLFLELFESWIFKQYFITVSTHVHAHTQRCIYQCYSAEYVL